MATNDIYTTFKCRKCDSEVKEIPLRDHWDEHVLSRFKCLMCGLDIYDYDDNFDDCIKTTYHKSHNSTISVNLRTMKIINLRMYGIEKKTFIIDIREYDINASDNQLRGEIISRIFATLSALGFTKEKIDTIKHVVFCDFLRCDNEGFITSTLYIDNLI